MSWRLTQAREVLRKRLTRRGVVLPGATLLALLATDAAPAAVPAAMLQAAVGAALSDTGSTTASALAEAVLHTMGVSKMKITIAALLAIGILGSGLGVAAFRSFGKDGDKAPIATETAKEEPKGGPPVKGLSLMLSADKTETTMKPDGSNAVPVELKLTFTNVGEQPIKVDRFDLALNHLSLTVIGPDAEAVRIDSFLLQRFRTPTPNADAYPVLKPKDRSSAGVYSVPGVLDLDNKRQTIVLRKPGEYRVKFAYHNATQAKNEFSADSWIGELVSNELVLKVNPADSGEVVKGLKLGLAPTNPRRC